MAGLGFGIPARCDARCFSAGPGLACRLVRGWRVDRGALGVAAVALLLSSWRGLAGGLWARAVTSAVTAHNKRTSAGCRGPWWLTLLDDL